MQSSLHELDLLLLFDNDRLSETPQNGIATVNQLYLRHVNRALMVRNHHRREIAIGVARGLGGHHAGVHTIHGLHHLRRECCVSGNDGVGRRIDMTMVLCVSRKARRDAKREGKTN